MSLSHKPSPTCLALTHEHIFVLTRMAFHSSYPNHTHLSWPIFCVEILWPIKEEKLLLLLQLSSYPWYMLHIPQTLLLLCVYVFYWSNYSQLHAIKGEIFHLPYSCIYQQPTDRLRAVSVERTESGKLSVS